MGAKIILVMEDSSVYDPWGLDFDTKWNLYISCFNGSCIRMVNKIGFISTIAGTGIQGNSGDGGHAISAQFNLPTNIHIN